MREGPERTGEGGGERDARSLWRRWRDGKGVTAEEVLRVASDLRPEQIAEAVIESQRQKWEGEDPVPAEEYLHRYPSLAGKPECAVDVIYHEFLIREERGERPRPEEYLSRFPSFREVLERQFALLTMVAADDDPLVPGIGPYEILEPIGMGSAGYVFRARHGESRREVALKVLHEHPLTGDARERFLAVAEAASHLDHPGIARPLDFGVAPEGGYIASPLVVGPTLASLLEEGPLPPAEAAEIVRKVAGAIGHADERGVGHPDLKAENVILDRGGEPVVTDFGIPSREEPGGAGAAQESPVRRLGRILYEALTGDRPPPGGPVGATFRAWSRGVPPPRRVNPAVSPELETICLQALAAAPPTGYPTAADLEKDLGAYLDRRPP